MTGFEITVVELLPQNGIVCSLHQTTHTCEDSRPRAQDERHAPHDQWPPQVRADYSRGCRLSLIRGRHHAAHAQHPLSTPGLLSSISQVLISHPLTAVPLHLVNDLRFNKRLLQNNAHCTGSVLLAAVDIPRSLGPECFCRTRMLLSH